MKQNDARIFVALISIALGAVLSAILFSSSICEELLIGWCRFAIRVVPKAKVHWDGVAIFSLGTLIACLLTHVFLRWLVHESQLKRQVPLAPWRLASSVSLVVIVLLIFLIGISMAGIVHQVGWIINSPEDRYVSTVQTEKDSMRSPYRPGVIATSNQASWIFEILPYSHYMQPEIDRAEPWNGESNISKAKGLVSDALCPSQGYPHKTPDGLGLTHIVGNSQVTESNRMLQLKDFGDASNTIFAGEIQVGFSPWAMPNNGRQFRHGIRNDWSNAPNENLGFGSSHTGGANILKVDGAVEFLSGKTDSRVLEQLGQLKLKEGK